MSSQKSKNEGQRTAVSLHPLSLRDAVRGLLETKPDKRQKAQDRDSAGTAEEVHRGEDEEREGKN